MSKIRDTNTAGGDACTSWVPRIEDDADHWSRADGLQQALWKGLSYLECAAQRAPTKSRDQLVARAEAALMPHLAKLTSKAERAEMLEMAARAGAMRIIEALPAIEDDGLAHLTQSGWSDVATHMPVSGLLLMEQKGLGLDWASLLAFMNAGRPELEAFVLETLSRNRWWFSEPQRHMKSWHKMPSSDTAAAFLKAQAEQFSDEMVEAWVTARRGACTQTALFFQTVAPLSSFDLEAYGDPRDWLRAQGKSNHESLALMAAHKSPDALHAFYLTPMSARIWQI